MHYKKPNSNSTGEWMPDRNEKPAAQRGLVNLIRPPAGGHLLQKEKENGWKFISRYKSRVKV